MHALLPSLLPAPAKQTHLADEELSGLLVLADLAEGDGSRAVPMRLLDSTCGRGALSGSLGGELLTGSLASGRFAGGLLGTSHFSRCIVFRSEPTSSFIASKLTAKVLSILLTFHIQIEFQFQDRQAL